MLLELLDPSYVQGPYPYPAVHRRGGNAGTSGEFHTQIIIRGLIFKHYCDHDSIICPSGTIFASWITVSYREVFILFAVKPFGAISH